jgi:cation transport regulator ChaB
MAEEMAKQINDVSTDELSAEQMAESEQQGEIPADIRDSLLDGSDQVFQAAYTSAKRDGLSKEAAMRVAWTTIEHGYEKGEDGKWHQRSPESGIHNKSITTGGN